MRIKSDRHVESFVRVRIVVATQEVTWYKPRSVADIEVKVHTDSLEEVVLQSNEANFDRNLQVLLATQLVELVCDLVVNFLRVANDET